jgi:hypothetical protein
LASFRAIKNLPISLQRRRARLLATRACARVRPGTQDLAPAAQRMTVSPYAGERADAGCSRCSRCCALPPKGSSTDSWPSPRFTLPTLAAAAEFTADQDGVNAASRCWIGPGGCLIRWNLA